MQKKTWLLPAGVLISLFASGMLGAANVPVEPYVDVSFATAGPLSLVCSPDGGGLPFSQAFDPLGAQVDGTLTIILYDDLPPWGSPVPNYPKEDIWLADLHGELAFCQEGTIPDQDTDAGGMTYWAQPLRSGGHAEPAHGNQLAIVVAGWFVGLGGLAEFRVNSPDHNGDGVVNLSDVVLFASNYFGAYDYASDFHWDGVLNLSDIVYLARSAGAQCP
jgi:hypothetical protein